MSGIWREPAEESVDLYPGLVVCDDRVTGSITLGQSRLPLWTLPGYLTDDDHGWAGYCNAYSYPDEPGDTVNGLTADDIGMFLRNLFEMRGEFGRLLLVLADAERVQGEREEAHMEQHAPGESVVRMDIGDGKGGCPFPDLWWEMPDVRAKVRDQLVRCIEVLDQSAASTGEKD